MVTITRPLDRLLDPLRDCLTPDVAARIVALRADAETQALLDDFAERNADGTLNDDERDEYTALVHAGTLIAVLQAKAAAVLGERMSSELFDVVDGPSENVA